MLDAFFRNPMLQRAIAEGERRLQSLVSSAQGARDTLERGVRRTLHAAKLPSSEDVEELKRRLAELESLLDDLAARLDRRGEAPPPPRAEGGERRG